MKKFVKLLVTIMCAALFAVPVFGAGCEDGDKAIDYVGQLQLDFTSNTKKQEVTVRMFIDGDTTHFDPYKDSTITTYNEADFADTDGYVKARYLAINTPESTGKIEEWGKEASNFTHSKLEKAKSIVIESDNDKWNVDSTGERYLLWVWYLPEDGTEYRNLNIEILQEGLAIGSSTANNRYGTIASAALEQAKVLERCIFSGERAPGFYYGAAIPVTLKELRCHVSEYENKKVAVEGVVTTEFSNSVYIEDFDPDTGLYFGFAVYYGFQTGKILEQLSVGNRVKVVGSVSEFNGTYQISGVSYNEYDLTSSSNTNIISTGHSAAFVETSAKDIVKGEINIGFEYENEAGETVNDPITLNYGEAIMSTTVQLSNLTVSNVYTTSKGASAGAMSLTCVAEDGTEITVRTEVLKDENGNVITASKYKGKKINVKGIIEKYTPDSEEPEIYYYQVKCYRDDFITIIG